MHACIHAYICTLSWHCTWSRIWHENRTKQGCSSRHFFSFQEWQNNKEALLKYMEATHMGVSGLVLDQDGQPIPGATVRKSPETIARNIWFASSLNLSSRSLFAELKKRFRAHATESSGGSWPRAGTLWWPPQEATRPLIPSMWSSVTNGHPGLRSDPFCLGGRDRLTDVDEEGKMSYSQTNSSPATIRCTM